MLIIAMWVGIGEDYRRLEWKLKREEMREIGMRVGNKGRECVSWDKS